MSLGARPPAAPRLVVSLPGGLTQEFTLLRASVTVGRHITCDVVLQDDTVSRTHVRVERSPSGFFTVVDLGSANGTRVNDAAITRHTLAPGDVIRLGASVLRFEAPSIEPAPELRRIDTERDLRATITDMPLPIILDESDGPRLAIHTPAKTWEVQLSGDSLAIGRGSDSDILLDFPGVSRHHAVLERRDEVFVLRDLESHNGTWMANDRITRTMLNDGETFRIGPASLVFKRGSTGAGDSAVDTREFAGARRPVVVIPGFAGSNLWLGSEQIWPSLKALSNPDMLGMQYPLEARGIVDEVVVVPNLLKLDQYSLLTDYLRETLGYQVGRDLLEFGYDFRRDNAAAAWQLAEAITKWNVSAPITIIAHSMGCLIARYYIERLGGRHKVERVILIGGPHSGSPYAFASLLTGPNLLPLGMMNLRLRHVLATMPSWYQILPTYGCVASGASALEVLADDTWVAAPQRPLLRAAREFRRELGAHSSVPTVCIFGYGMKTVTGASVERDARGEVTKADLQMTESGDGTIPERSAVLKGAEIHPVRQHHGSLYVDSDVRMRLKLELTRPATSGMTLEHRVY